MKKTLLTGILLLFIAALAISCNPRSDADVESPANSYSVIAEGRLLPTRVIDMSFMVGGQVAEVLVEDGEEIRKGQVLARLVESAEAQAILTGAKKEALAAQQALDDYEAAAVVNLAQSQIEAILAAKSRTTKLQNYNASGSRESKARLDEATGEMEIAEERFRRIEENDGLDPDRMNTLEAQVEATNANVASAQEILDARELKATMAGTVTDIRLIPGQRVEVGEVVMAVADFSEWIIETDNLTEIDVVEIEAGQLVEVTLDALPGMMLVGEVVNINARFEEKRGDITYTTTVLLTETDPRMRWGMTAAVRFDE